MVTFPYPTFLLSVPIVVLNRATYKHRRLTVQYVHVAAGRLGVVWHTRVVPGVPRCGAGDAQRAELPQEVRGDVDLVVPVVVDHAVVVVPEHELRRLRALDDGALKHHA